MANCVNIKKNTAQCNCTYEGCSRHAICCECLEYHRMQDEVPACYFDKRAERAYDRSITNYVKSKGLV